MTGNYRSALGKRIVEQRYRKLLDTWPVEKTELRVPTREGETFVVVSGPEDAPPVIALQGSGANSAMWLPSIAELSARLRVYAVDVIGEPGFSAPSRPELGSEAYSWWLDDVLRELGVAKAVFLGVSLGGWFAIDYASRRPDAVSKLALQAPSGIGRQKLGVLFKAIALRPFGDWGARKLLRGVSGVDVPKDDGLVDLTLSVGKQFQYRMGAIPIFSDETLAGLKMPVFVEVGGKDSMTDTHATQRRVEAHVPNALVRMLPDAGHVPLKPSRPLLKFLGGAP